MSEMDSIIANLEQRRKALDTAITALRGNDGKGPNSISSPTQPGLTEGRKRQIEAMRRYWRSPFARTARSSGR